MATDVQRQIDTILQETDFGCLPALERADRSDLRHPARELLAEVAGYPAGGLVRTGPFLAVKVGELVFLVAGEQVVLPDDGRMLQYQAEHRRGAGFLRESDQAPAPGTA